MNKKLLVIIASLAALLVIGGGVFAAIYFGGSDKKSDDVASAELNKRSDDTAIFYLDFGQLLNKSAIYDMLGPSNRELVATVLSANVENGQWKNYAKSLFNDPKESGLDIDKPLYCYVNADYVGERFEVVFVAEVADVEKVDKLFGFFSACFEQEYGSPLDVTRKGDVRHVDLGTMAVGYNKSRLVAGYIPANAEGFSYDEMVDRALKRSKLNLNAYKGYDFAADLNMSSVLDLAIYDANEDLEVLEYELQEFGYDEFEREYYTEYIAEVKNKLEMLERLKSQFSKNANVVLGVAFEDGRIVAEAKANGFNSEYKLDTKVSNNHLAAVNSNALAVLNMGVNGEALAKIVEENIDPKYAALFNMERNEFNIFAGVLCDALKSINGDLTLALEGIRAQGNYGATTIEAMLRADVEDDYIISNISQYAGGFLDKCGENLYSVSFAGNNLVVSQHDDNVFSVDLNNSLDIVRNPATEAKWYEDVKDGYGYLVLNVDAMMRNPLISQYYNYATYSMSDMEAEIVDDIVDAVSYAYMNIDTPQSAQLVIVLDDKDTNSLEQIVNIVMPHVVREVAKDFLRF